MKIHLIIFLNTQTNTICTQFKKQQYYYYIINIPFFSSFYIHVSFQYDFWFTAFDSVGKTWETSCEERFFPPGGPGSSFLRANGFGRTGRARRRETTRMEILKSTRVRWRFVLDIFVQFYLGEINLYTDNIVTNTAIRTLNSQADFFLICPGPDKTHACSFLALSRVSHWAVGCIFPSGWQRCRRSCK